jgi:hypothetical protein
MENAIVFYLSVSHTGFAGSCSNDGVCCSLQTVVPDEKAQGVLSTVGRRVCVAKRQACMHAKHEARAERHGVLCN